MQKNTEQEWQFTTPALAAARDWLAAQPRESSGRHFAARPTLDLHDTYFDSADWMIYRAGFALRLRQSRVGAGDATHEVTLKSLTPGRPGGLAQRTEISQKVSGSDIANVIDAGDGIGERIRELVGARPLSELFRAHTRRERQCLLEADNEVPLAEIDLDDTRLEVTGHADLTLQRVEVECLNAEPAAIGNVVDDLRAAAQLTPADRSKFEAGLDLAGLRPGPPLSGSAPALLASQPFESALGSLLRRYFVAVLDGEPAVRLGSPKDVHDMRVAARHLDALLRAARDLAPRWASQGHGGVRALVKRLGEVRDCDVQAAHIDASLESHPEDREALQPLRERLAGERNRAWHRLLREFDSPRIQAFHQNWLAALRSEPGAAAAGSSTGDVAEELIRGQYRKLRKRADRLGEESGAEDFHRVRIRAKRLRYLLDAFENLYGPAAQGFGRALAKLQDVLGEFHDATVREQRFSEIVNRAALPPATAFAVGRMVERDSKAFERCRKRFAKAWRRARGRRWRALRESMSRQAAGETS